MSAAAVAVANPAGKPAVQPVPEVEDPRWRPVMGLPCELTVDLSLPGFKVAGFLALRVGSVISTAWGVARDVPVRVNGTLIGSGEMEGSGSRLAVRITELV